MKHFTKQTLSALLLALCAGGTMQAQYQLPNPGFEGTWTSNTRGTYTEMTPAGWNSFYKAKTNSLTALAFTMNQVGPLSQSDDAHRGAYSAKITAKTNFLGSTSNGNLTLGRINMGSTTASDASNHNFTDLSSDTCSYAFSGLPDSVSVWVKVVPALLTDSASVNFVLHKRFAYKEPHETAENVAAYRIAYAKNMAIAKTVDKDNNLVWKRVCIPFIYNEDTMNSTDNFLLASFSTNGKPGTGSGGDALYVDDVQMIYNSQLSDLKYDGTTIAGFKKDVYEYSINKMYAPIELQAIADGIGAEVSVSYDPITAVAIVRVQGNDFSVNNANFHEYTLTFIKRGVEGFYTGKLNVTLADTPCPETDEYVTIEINEDYTVNLVLKDFYLVTGTGPDDRTGVGTIRIPNIEVFHPDNEGDDFVLYSLQNIEIAAGSEGDPQSWMGPLLGEVPIELNAKGKNEVLTVDIDIDMANGVHVRFDGTKSLNALPRIDGPGNRMYVYRIDDFNVGIAGAAEGSPYRVYSHSGMMVMNGKLQSEQLNIERLPRGVYILRIGNKQARFMR